MACVTRWWAGAESVSEHTNTEARKMLENAAEYRPSGPCCVEKFLFSQYYSLMNSNFLMVKLLVPDDKVLTLKPISFTAFMSSGANMLKGIVI